MNRRHVLLLVLAIVTLPVAKGHAQEGLIERNRASIEKYERALAKDRHDCDALHGMIESHVERFTLESSLARMNRSMRLYKLAKQWYQRSRQWAKWFLRRCPDNPRVSYAEEVLAWKRRPAYSPQTEEDQPGSLVQEKTESRRTAWESESIAKANRLVKTNKTKEALLVFKAVLKRNPRSCDALVGAGVSHAKIGNRYKAAAYYRKFVKSCPKDRRAGYARQTLRAFEEKTPSRRLRRR
jgi:tetratricopeptide (TPR) repeat protein